jgi:lysophospholipase L1-like esterase
MTRSCLQFCSLFALILGGLAIQGGVSLRADETTEANLHPASAIRPAYTNTAIVPVSRLEEVPYDWEERHAEILEIQKYLSPEIILIGDSITHLWGGVPLFRDAHGTNSWKKTFGNHRVLNLGFGWDRTQNVLWRLEHGELDGTDPNVVVINIGSNNLTASSYVRANTPKEIAEAIVLICGRVRQKVPRSRILVMGVFPRGFDSDDYYRAKVITLNDILAKQLAGKAQITFLDISDRFVARSAVLSRKLMDDGVHPTEAGYAIWGEALLKAGIFK